MFYYFILFDVMKSFHFQRLFALDDAKPCYLKLYEKIVKSKHVVNV